MEPEQRTQEDEAGTRRVPPSVCMKLGLKITPEGENLLKLIESDEADKLIFLLGAINERRKLFRSGWYYHETMRWRTEHVRLSASEPVIP